MIRLIASDEDGPVSVILIVGFGPSVVYKRGGWSGRAGSSRPNELLHWSAMLWAKEQGYRTYDLDGIDPAVARMVMNGEPIPAEVWVSVAVAAVSGYAAIAILIRLLGRIGLAPFGIYCVSFGTLASFLL